MLIIKGTKLDLLGLYFEWMISFMYVMSLKYNYIDYNG